MASGFMAIFTKLEKYDGTEDLTSWFKKFERCCTLANKNEDNVKGQLVMLCLSGQALAATEQLDAERDWRPCLIQQQTENRRWSYSKIRHRS